MKKVYSIDMLMPKKNPKDVKIKEINKNKENDVQDKIIATKISIFT